MTENFIIIENPITNTSYKNNEIISKKFFNLIKTQKIFEIKNIIHYQNYKPWEFLEEDDYSVLHRAVYSNNDIIVEVLLTEMKKRFEAEEGILFEEWVNKKTKKQGFSALHYASYHGNIHIIKVLIENKANFKIRSYKGIDLIQMACQGNKVNSLIYLKEKYLLDIESRDDMLSTPLHWASYYGAEECILFLLKWNVFINPRDRDGSTPLHLAVLSERTKIVKRLIFKGADMSLLDNKDRNAYALANEKKKFQIAEMLSERKFCYLFSSKIPLRKIERNRRKIFFFYFSHLFFEMILITFTCPCKNKLKKN